MREKSEAPESNSSVLLVSDRALKVIFTTLVIRVRSIEQYWPGGMNAYVQGPAKGIANDQLAVMAEMSSSAPMLEEFIAKELEPRGFKIKRDFVIGEEELMEGVLRHPAPKPTELRWCKGIPWLRSFHTAKGWRVEAV